MSETNEVPTEAPPERKTLWTRTKYFFGGGFGKGMLITALIFIGVMAVMGGTLVGSEALGGLSVDWIPVGTIENGISAGISKTLEFFAKTYVGWATLAAGGLVGAYVEKHYNKELNEKEAALNAAKEHEKSLQMALQKKLQLDPVPTREAEQLRRLPAAETRQPAQLPDLKSDGNKNNGGNPINVNVVHHETNYENNIENKLENNIQNNLQQTSVQNNFDIQQQLNAAPEMAPVPSKTFSAKELQRRAECEATAATKSL